MTVRPAIFTDLPEVSILLLGLSEGKAEAFRCRKRGAECIKRANRKGGKGVTALVAELDGKIVGFLFAEERPALELVPKSRYCEVAYLTGKNAAKPLLRALQGLTRLPILFPAHVHWGTMKSYARLLRGIGPVTEVGTIFQLEPGGVSSSSDSSSG